MEVIAIKVSGVSYLVTICCIIQHPTFSSFSLSLIGVSGLMYFNNLKSFVLDFKHVWVTIRSPEEREAISRKIP